MTETIRNTPYTTRVKGWVVLPAVKMIAIVEDDASVRAATQSLVRSLGFSACSFSDAEEFLRSPCATKASCLIADVQMPGMSGIDLQSVLAPEVVIRPLFSSPHSLTTPSP